MSQPKLFSPQENGYVRCPELSNAIARAERCLKSPLCLNIDQRLATLEGPGQFSAFETHNKLIEIPTPEAYSELLDVPTTCEFRKRTILVYFEFDEIKSFFFCLRVQEDPFRRVSAVEYMESVPRIIDKNRRTHVYYTILGSYFNDVRYRGYTHVYIRAEPPDHGEDYIFPGCWSARAAAAAEPDYDYLCQWYERCFELLKNREKDEEPVIVQYTDSFKHILTYEQLKQLPILDGDTCLCDTLAEALSISRVRSPERYAELFSSAMQQKGRQRPYPEIYYTLFLGPAPAQRLRVRDWVPEVEPIDNMTATRKGIYHFCARHGLTFATPQEATIASQAIRHDLYQTFVTTHVEHCQAKCCTRIREAPEELLSLCCGVIGYCSVDQLSAWLGDVKLGTDSDNAITSGANEIPLATQPCNDDGKADEVHKEVTYTPPRTRSKTESIADRVAKRKAQLST